MFLVVNENKNSDLLPVAERHKLFRDPGKAMDHASKIGFRDPWFLGLKTEPGIANVFRHGDTNVSIISLAVSDEGAGP